MTTPSTGAISLGQVRAENGTPGAVGLNDSMVRALAGIDTGSISLSDLYGKTGASGPTPVVVGLDDLASDTVTGVQFQARCYPAVNVSAGTPPYAYQWSITTQSDAGFSLLAATSDICEVRHIVGKYGYVGGCTLTCVVSDSKGQSATKTGIRADFDFQQDSDS